MVDLDWVKDNETNRWTLFATNNTGGEIHNYSLIAAGRYMFYPPPWPNGESHPLWTRIPGQGNANIAVSYSLWYEAGDVNNEFPIEQHTPNNNGQGNN